MDLERILARTALRQRLGLRYPIVQAGMGQVAYGALAGAVSAAGGLGVIGSGYLSADELRREIRIVREITDRPFGVDILFAKVAGEDESAKRYTRQVEDQIRVTLEERVPVLISGLGNPLDVVPECRARGILVMSVVGNVRQAKRLAAAGVDVLIASGAEGGGHVGRVGTIALVPAVVSAVELPVLAGGGIADGRGLVAALALGAQGIWMGTRFIASTEARAHENYKNRLVTATDEDTVVSRGHSGKTARMLRNRFTDYWAENEAKILPYPRQLQEVGTEASIRGRIEGDVENGVLPAGQSVALVDATKPAAAIVEEIVEEARRVLHRLESGSGVGSTSA